MKRLMAVVVVLVLASCGGGGDDGEGAKSSSTALGTTTALATTTEAPTTTVAPPTTVKTATTQQVASVVAGHMPDIRRYADLLDDCFLFPEDCDPLVAPIRWDTLHTVAGTLAVELENVTPPAELDDLVERTIDAANAVVAADNSQPCRQGGPDCVLLLAGFATDGLLAVFDRWAPYL